MVKSDYNGEVETKRYVEAMNVDMMLNFVSFYGKVRTESRGIVNIIFHNFNYPFKCQRHTLKLARGG